MARNKNRKVKKNLSKLLLLLFLVLGALILFQFSQKKQSQIAQSESLQLGTFQPSNPPHFQQPQIPNEKRPPTNTPTPITPQQEVCPSHTGKKVSNTCMCGLIYIVCKDQKCVDVKREKTEFNIPSDFSCEQVDKDHWCEPPFANEGDGNYCLAKPIIYLYPEAPIFVDIKIESIGSVVVSNPLYPEGGWKNVLAYPNGNLSYLGKQYRDLFYETDIKDFDKPNNGINIARKNIKQELSKILTQLGLNTFEKKEFIDYWVPILNNEEKPYIQFSLIQGEVKERIDKVIISPKPETFIYVLAYFKPLDEPFQGENLTLPSQPPTRIGFTAVEWGGVIDRK